MILVGDGGRVGVMIVGAGGHGGVMIVGAGDHGGVIVGDRNVSTVLRQPSRKMSVQKLFRHTAVEKPWTAAAAWKTLRLPPGLRVYTPRC